VVSSTTSGLLAAPLLKLLWILRTTTLATILAQTKVVAHLCNVARLYLARPPPHHQAMLNDKVEKLQATITWQQQQIETLTAQLKEQAAQFTTQLKEEAAQIQKVSAQLEMSKPAPQVVANKP